MHSHMQHACVVAFAVLKLDYILAKLVAFIKRFTRDIFSYLCWNGLNIKAHEEIPQAL